MVIRAIDGMPGVGKTALAVHAAHQLAHHFPDRQLFVDLHGHTPGQDPVPPADALAGLLAAVGVEPRYVPVGLADRASMWRDKLAGQRVLLVLDNAANSAQVMALLPGSGGCLVLLTSRRHLADLPVAVVPVMVEILPAEQARAMFVRLAPRAAGDPDAVAELAGLAGHLPLAISLLARVYTRHPAWTLPDLISETRARLLTLTAEHVSVAAAFEVSWQHLQPGWQEFFCALGLHPAASTDAYAAAALAGIGLGQAARLLDGLHAEGLLTETGYRRYGMHDLIRRYAADRAAETMTAAERDAAVGRLLDYYQHAAARAEALLAWQTKSAAADRVVQPCALPVFADSEQALAWARAERPALVACLDHAAATGQQARVVALSAGLAELLSRDGPWIETLTRHAVAVQAARDVGDRSGQAYALLHIGRVRHMTGDYPGAAEVLGQALAIFTDLADLAGRAGALHVLGLTWMMTGDYPAAASDLGQALGIFGALGDRLGQANVLLGLGCLRLQAIENPAAPDCQAGAAGPGDHGMPGAGLQVAGGHRAAARDLAAALALYRELGSRLGQADALSNLAKIRGAAGDYQAADRDLVSSLEIYHELGSRLGQANAFIRLGRLRRLTGDYRAAAEVLARALDIYRDLGERGGQTSALNEIGALHHVSGAAAAAAACYQQALELAREITVPQDEALALAGLGRCALVAGDAATATGRLRQAQEILQRGGCAEAAQIAAELDVLALLDA